MKRVKINDITIRDIFQNTELNYLDRKKISSILSGYRDLKFDSLEIMGGSGFENMLSSSLGMNPFEIAYFIKQQLPSATLQVLIGAKSLTGPEVYSGEIIKKFISLCLKNGINSFRVYDSLNDLDNMKFTVSEIVDKGGACQGTIIYDNLLDIGCYIDSSRKLEKMGCSSICIKDAENTIMPGHTAKLFDALSVELKVPVFFSASNLRGLQTLNYYEACVSGCGGVDLSFIPSSYNDFTPTLFSFMLGLKDADISFKVDYEKAVKLAELIKKDIYPYIRHDLFSTRFILNQSHKSLMPKWLISSIDRQLREIGENKSLDVVLEEVLRIKDEIGNPSLSTPVGQIIGSQAILNTVISDNRWEILCDEIKKLIWGYFGKLPREVNEKITSKLESISEEEKSRIKTENGNVYQQCEKELENKTCREEDILSYCLYPEKTGEYLNKKESPASKKVLQGVKIGTAGDPGGTGNDPVSILGKLDTKKFKEITDIVESSNIDEITFELEGIKISINSTGKQTRIPENYQARDNNITGNRPGFPKVEQQPGTIIIRSPIVGTFYTSPGPEEPPFVKAGDRVKKGDTLFIVEAMKLMNRVKSEDDGEIIEILAANEDALEYDQPVMVLKEK